MNFTVLFATVSMLSFTLRYELDSNTKQDFFYFQGDNSSAHLSRWNDTLILYVNNDKNYEIYKYFNISSGFTFSWEGYKVNNEKMFLEKSSGKIHYLNFDSYVFLSPSTQSVFEPDVKPILDCNEINYGYIIIILIAGIIGIEVKQLIPHIYRKINSKESAYVNMETINTNV